MTIPEPNQHSGPVAGHIGTGRVFEPPLVASGKLFLGDWALIDLPDFLWPVLVLSEFGTSWVRRFVDWQRDVLKDLPAFEDQAFVADCLDGRLTGLDRLVAQIPDARESIRLRAEEHELLPDSVQQAMSAYPGRPAGWLVEASRNADKETYRRIAVALREVLTDGHREAIIKCIGFWSAASAGTFRSTSEMIELLKVYPGDMDTRTKTDVVVRASWGARRSMLVHDNEGHFDETSRWSDSFWVENLRSSLCMRDKRTQDDEPPPDGEALPDGNETSHGESEVNLQQLTMDMLASYVQALEISEPGAAHDTDRQEVHAGLVARLGRDLIAVLGAPDLWCMEHSAHIVRGLVETRIYLEWMSKQDPSIYPKYKDYGAGKAKLYAKIMDELPEEARTEDLEDGIEELQRLSYNGDVIDHRVVDTRDTFAGGKSLRAMAKECGLLDFYRQLYYMASGVSHSEWWSVESHAMVRCQNVLHGGHLIPNLMLNAGGNREIARSWVDQFETLVHFSLRTLEISKEAFEKSFDWLYGDDSGDPQEPDSESSADR